MWIHISKIAKTAIFSTQTKWKTVHKLFFAKPSTIIVENTENSPNSSSYTIECKLVRNSHLLSQKLAFSQVPQQLFFKQVQIAHTQILKSSN